MSDEAFYWIQTLARLGRTDEAIELLNEVRRELLVAHMPLDDDLANVRAAPGLTGLLDHIQPAMA